LLVGPCIDLSAVSNADWAFDYHMYGSAMGSLEAQVAIDCGSAWQTRFSRSGQQHGSNGAAYSHAVVSLQDFVGGQVKLRFRAVTGSSYTSDMAIDNSVVTVTP
jgi:hypothetical protein